MTHFSAFQNWLHKKNSCFDITHGFALTNEIDSKHSPFFHRLFFLWFSAFKASMQIRAISQWLSFFLKADITSNFSHTLRNLNCIFLFYFFYLDSRYATICLHSNRVSSWFCQSNINWSLLQVTKFWEHLSLKMKVKCWVNGTFWLVPYYVTQTDQYLIGLLRFRNGLKQWGHRKILKSQVGHRKIFKNQVLPVVIMYSATLRTKKLRLDTPKMSLFFQKYLLLGSSDDPTILRVSWYCDKV